MPSLKGYVDKFGKIPKCISASLAFYIQFYTGKHLEENALIGVRGDNEYEIKDDRPVLEFFDAHKDDCAADMAEAVLSNTDFWGEDLTQIPGLLDDVTKDLETVRDKGTYEVMKECLK